MYTVRTEFEVPKTFVQISLDEFEMSDGQLSWNLKANTPYHVLTVRGFPTEEEADAFVKRLPAALAYLLLERGITVEISFTPLQVMYFPDPVKAAEGFSHGFGIEINEPIDGCINGAGIAVYPTAKTVRAFTGGRMSVYSTAPAEQVLQSLRTGASLTGAQNLESDLKLLTALRLYGAYFTEQSATARFLTLIMALEALSVTTPRSQIILQLLNRWTNEIQVIRESMRDQNDVDDISLEALERQLQFLRSEDSIRAQIRKLVANELVDEPDAPERAREAVRLYDLRSTLVHTGYLDPVKLDAATATAKMLVHRVLICRFKRATTAA